LRRFPCFWGRMPRPVLPSNGSKWDTTTSVDSCSRCSQRDSGPRETSLTRRIDWPALFGRELILGDAPPRG
jgi:hypothetical protein